MSKLRDQPAFPVINGSLNSGLTKREYFAGLMVQNLSLKYFDLCKHRELESINSSPEQVIAITALKIADELLKVLEK